MITLLLQKIFRGAQYLPSCQSYGSSKYMHPQMLGMDLELSLILACAWLLNAYILIEIDYCLACQ